MPAEATQTSLYVTTASNAPLGGLAPVATIDVPVLTAGAEMQWTQLVSLPTLSAGYYHLVALTDSGAARAEGSETNNRRSMRFEVGVPAVTVDAVSLAPSLVQPGQTATASVRIMNHGRVSSRPTTANVFLATSDSAALLEGTSAQTLAIGSLRPGASVSLPVSLIVPLADPGAYYVIAQVDASTAGGSEPITSASAMPVAPAGTRPRKSTKLRVSLPDLTLTRLGVSRNLVEPRASVTVSVTVRNAGAMSAPASSVGVYLTERPDADKIAAWGLRSLSVPALAANASTVLTTSITIPAIPGGSHHLLVIADPGDSIAESP